MSQENVERLRAHCATWGMDQEPDVDLLDPDVVFEDDILPDHVGETYRGHEGVRRSVRTWLQPYERFTIELEQIVGSGDRLVSIHRFRSKARYTGIEDDLRYAYAWTFRDGKVIHFRSFREPEAALEAVGLAG
jgi:ketosteroid isomerase-like protein